MGTYSHEQLQQLRAEGIKPPVASRRCQGQKFWPAVVNWDTGEETRAAQWVSCASGAIPFVEEVAYCGHHMPPPWQDVANERLVLFNRLAVDLWNEVRIAVPPPNGSAS